MKSELDEAFSVIEELLEPCEKCGKVAKGGRMTFPTGDDMSLCEECHEDIEGFTTWFEAELEKAVKESDEFEQMADGKWRRKQCNSLK